MEIKDIIPGEDVKINTSQLDRLETFTKSDLTFSIFSESEREPEPNEDRMMTHLSFTIGLARPIPYYREDEIMNYIKIAVLHGMIGETGDTEIPYEGVISLRTFGIEENYLNKKAGDILGEIAHSEYIYTKRIDEKFVPIPEAERAGKVGEIQEYFRDHLFPKQDFLQSINVGENSSNYTERADVKRCLDIVTSQGLIDVKNQVSSEIQQWPEERYFLNRKNVTDIILNEFGEEWLLILEDLLTYMNETVDRADDDTSSEIEISGYTDTDNISMQFGKEGVLICEKILPMIEKRPGNDIQLKQHTLNIEKVNAMIEKFGEAGMLALGEFLIRLEHYGELDFPVPIEDIKKVSLPESIDIGVLIGKWVDELFTKQQETMEEEMNNENQRSRVYQHPSDHYQNIDQQRFDSIKMSTQEIVDEYYHKLNCLHTLVDENIFKGHMETAIEKNKHSIDEAVESKNFLEAKKQFIAWGCIKNNLSDCYRSSIGAIIGDGSDKSLVKREDAILSELLPTLKERDIPYADLIYLLENSISKKFASYIPQGFNAYDRNMKQVVIGTGEPVIVAKHIQEPISNENKYEILPEQEEETMKAIELAVRGGLIGKTEDVDIPYFTSYNNVRVRVFQDNEYGLDVMDIYRFILRGIKLGVIKIHQEERLPIPKDQRPENIAEVQEYFRKILFPVKQEIS